ncbi:hypothetical protein [Methanospirillum hungatei]|nr:hypothetical protein [Methanospirillum hungatei]
MHNHIKPSDGFRISGAFEDTRNNLNQCIDAINLLVFREDRG